MIIYGVFIYRHIYTYKNYISDIIRKRNRPIAMIQWASQRVHRPPAGTRAPAPRRTTARPRASGGSSPRRLGLDKMGKKDRENIKDWDIYIYYIKHIIRSSCNNCLGV